MASRPLAAPLGRRSACGLAAALLVTGQPAAAPAWPGRPITLVVPFPPGGNNDILARLLAPSVGEELGQPVVIENRAGGGGAIGAAAAARAEPDGHTLLMADMGILAIAPHLPARLPFGPESFQPVIRLTEVPLVVGVPPNSPHWTLRELLSAASARPGSLSFASPGIGTAGHLAALALASPRGARMVHVPYRGSGPAVRDLVSGRVDMMIDGALCPWVEGGQVRALATTGPGRSPFLPAIPTADEAGAPGFAFLSWHGVVAPRGISPERVARLNTAFNSALRTPAVAGGARRAGLALKGGAVADFATFAAAETARIGPLVRSSGAAAG